MKRIALALALVIMSASLAFAQAPDPVPVEGEHGAAYLSYGYTSGAAASLDNLQFDFDLALPGTVVSVRGPLHRQRRRARRAVRLLPGRTH